LASCLLSKNVKIRIYKTIILPVVLYGCDTWSHTVGRNNDRWCLRTGCWGEYLDRSGMKW
jgi:hypothetical protein